MRSLRLCLAAGALVGLACSSDPAPDVSSPESPATDTTLVADDAATDDPVGDGGAGYATATGGSGGDVSKTEPARDAGEVDAPAGVQPSGFDVVTVRVTAESGETCDVCLWDAQAPEDRARGLMGVTDLGEPVGMLFRFDEATAGNFFMFGTPMPLSIAWFAPDGAHVGEADMAPCLVEDSSECDRFNPGGASYQFAIEMVQGELGVVGIGPGSMIEILGVDETCPTQN